MSSTGQAFVKSFARRSQTNSTKAHVTQTITPSAVSASAQTPPNRLRTTTAAELESAELESAELESAELWVDSFDDTKYRLDRKPGVVPKPHLQTGSLQHNFTAYEPIVVDPTIDTVHDGQIEIGSAPSSDLPDLAPASESPEAILAARVARVLEPRDLQTEPVAELDATENVAVNLTPQIERPQVKDFQASETLSPSWEVEVFDIPQPVADLFFEESLFQDLSDRMKEASQGGLRTMLMTSALTGEGRTTVAIGVALAAAASGLRVALVDGDLAQPTLAEELRLDLDHSWVESVRRGVPMKEIAVHAVEDNLTLIPLLPTDSGRQATAVECAQMIESLKPSFDLIIVDGPTADARDIRMLGSAIDSVIIVHDINQSSDAAADLLAARLQRAGIDGVGIVENFA